MSTRQGIAMREVGVVMQAREEHAVRVSGEACNWSGVRERVTAKCAQLLPLVADRAFERKTLTLSSGRQSEYYVDGKQVTLSPDGSLLVSEIILEALRGQPVDVIGGLTIGADPMVSGVVVLSAVRNCPIPGFIVRTQPKRHGKMLDIEGPLRPGSRAVIVDDVITSGRSILSAIEKTEAHGVHVAGVLALTDREEGGKAALEAKGYPTFAIFTAKQLAETKERQ